MSSLASPPCRLINSSLCFGASYVPAAARELDPGHRGVHCRHVSAAAAWRVLCGAAGSGSRSLAAAASDAAAGTPHSGAVGSCLYLSPPARRSPSTLRRAIVAEGWNAVVWSAETDDFPYLKGMSSIVSGWRMGVAVWRFANCQQRAATYEGVHADCCNAQRKRTLCPLLPTSTCLRIPSIDAGALPVPHAHLQSYVAPSPCGPT